MIANFLPERTYVSLLTNTVYNFYVDFVIFDR